MIPSQIKHFVPLSWRQAYWSLPALRKANEKHYARDCRVLGRRAAVYLRWSTYVPRRILALRLPGYDHPIFFRPRSSDIAVIRQIFAGNEYGAVAELDKVNLIFDCGANIGCSAFYFLHKYPFARVVVVEPDPGNMAICRMNLQPFANRVSFIEAAVWSSSSPLKVERGHYRDGQAWSFQVRPCRTGESPDVQGLTVDELIAGSGGAPVDLLKMDIEAAERDVFAADGPRWIAHVRNIAVELHDDECVRLFRNAIGMSSWSETQSGDLTICRRIQTA